MMELNTGKEQHSNRADDSLTNIALLLYPIVLMLIASLVPVAYHFTIKMYRSDCKSVCRAGRNNNHEATWNSASFRYDSETCPICLSTPSLPLATNCGHVFCATCLRAVWRNYCQHMLEPYISCPMCRTKLYELLPVNADEVLFSSVMAPPTPASFNDNDYVTLYDFISQFNDTYYHFAEPEPLMTCLWKFIVRSVQSAYKFAFRTGYQNPAVGVLLSVLTPILYIGQPNNLIGDSLGYMDDVVVVVLCIYPLVNYVKFLQQAHHT